MSGGLSADEAYARCEQITRSEAANFYYGIRLLPAPRRRAMSAVYAFARRIDDIADGTLAPAEKARALDEQAEALEALERDGAPSDRTDAVLVALADARARFPLPLDALGELIEGVRMDLQGRRYETFEELVVYCRRVAGTIGRLCLSIFGQRPGVDPVLASALADDLGVALQLTNILRDIREDAQGGRVYLPLEDLHRFGLIERGSEAGAERALLAAVSGAGAAADDAGASSTSAARLAELVGFESERARSWFDRGLTLAPLLDRRSAACLLAMAGIYRRVLERIDDDPARVARGRVSLPMHEKAWVAARGMLGVAP
ncbi:MAG TPA: presqualene diphosphate synthase HpnD [Solirubrobacteraceae bacterium]|jgi:phytoene synthase